MKVRQTFLILAIGLLTLSLATRLVVAGAVSESRFRVEHSPKLSDDKPSGVDAWVVKSEPPGAKVSLIGESSARSPIFFTPGHLEVSSSESSMTIKADFESLFHFKKDVTIQTEANSPPVVLQLKLPVWLLVNGFWPGLALLAAFFWSGRAKSEKIMPSQALGSPTEPAQEMPSAPDLTAAPAQDTPQELVYGSFLQEEKIGEGGMGTVYRCRSVDQRDSRDYALKVLNRDFSKENQFRERFLRESAICQSLEHPNVIRAFQAGEKDRQLWLVMEFVDGLDLGQWVADHKPEAVAIVKIFEAICSGLHYAHQKDLVHRDLKPDNILLELKTLRPVIVDFGLVKDNKLDTITVKHTTLGTPIYMAPEQISGDKPKPPADLYSLGCVLYQCLSGRVPFAKDDLVEVLNQKILGKGPPSLCTFGIEIALSAVVDKAMAPDPKLRFQDADEFKMALANWRLSKISEPS